MKENQDSKIKQELDNYDWGQLFADERPSILTGLLPWLSIILQIAILILILRG